MNTTTQPKTPGRNNETITARPQSLGQSKAGEGSKTPGQRRAQRQAAIKTPPEEKLKRIQNDIVKRSAMQDLMYRQQQLEEAVKEARRVNIMIEEEKQKMRELKARMLENNLTQYVTITKQEIKGKGKDGDTLRKSVKKVDDAERDSDQESLPGLIPPIEERRKTKKKNDAPALPSSANMFDDNYAFYMYYLNKSGQLVTPVEQMFQDNAEKTEQIRRLQEELEKKSRVVKPKVNGTSQSPPPNQTDPGKTPTGTKTLSRLNQSAKSNRVIGAAASKSKLQAPQSPIKSVNVNNNNQTSASQPPVKRNFLRRSPAPPAPGISQKSGVKPKQKQLNQEGSTEDSFERDTSAPAQLRSQSIQNIGTQHLMIQDEQLIDNKQRQDSQPIIEQPPPKKFPFLKRTAKNPTSPIGTKSKVTAGTPSKKLGSKAHLKSMSQDQVHIQPSNTEEEVKVNDRTNSLEQQDSPTQLFELHQIPTSSQSQERASAPNSPDKSPSVKKKPVQSRFRINMASIGGKQTAGANSGKQIQAAGEQGRSSSTASPKKGPQILIKKSTTIIQREREDEVNQQENIDSNLEQASPSTSQGNRLPQSKQVKKGASQSVKASLETSESASTLHLPPLVKPSALLQQQPTTTTSTSQQLPSKSIKPSAPQRPPLPTVKSSLSQSSALKVQTRTSSDTLMTLPSIPSSTTNQQQSKAQQQQPISDFLLHNQSSSSLTLQHHDANNNSRASSRLSSRSGGDRTGHNLSKHINYHPNVIEEKRAREQAKRDKQIEYYKEVRASHKPKLDPKKQMEIEIRQNSISLNQLELSAREHPIKKVQLSDLLL